MAFEQTYYPIEKRCYLIGTPDEVSQISDTIPIAGPITLANLKALIETPTYEMMVQIVDMFLGGQIVDPVASEYAKEVRNINVYVNVQRVPYPFMDAVIPVVQKIT